MTTVLNRRDRLRAATVSEIKETARRILVEAGPEGLSLRAIAREMGMTAPALYRYFPSREELLLDLTADLYDELADAMEAAKDEADPAPDQLVAVSRAFRGWALAHRPEFGLLFGRPVPGTEDGPAAPDAEQNAAEEAADRFGMVFGRLVAEIYTTHGFPIPADDELDLELVARLREWCHALPEELPAGAAQVFLSCWIRLYGMVAMEVFGHLRFAVLDAAPLFEMELDDLARKLGVPRDSGMPRG